MKRDVSNELKGRFHRLKSGREIMLQKHAVPGTAGTLLSIVATSWEHPPQMQSLKTMQSTALFL